MILIEGGMHRRTAVSRRAECDVLLGLLRIGFVGIVRRDEMGNVDELIARRRFPCKPMCCHMLLQIVLPTYSVVVRPELALRECDHQHAGCLVDDL
jgi:hypothetical protein